MKKVSKENENLERQGAVCEYTQSIVGFTGLMRITLTSRFRVWRVSCRVSPWACAGLFWPVLAAPVPAGLTPHTPFEVRLLTSVSSYRSKPGDEVRAAVVVPGCPESGYAFPPGTIVRGTIRSVHRVGLGIIHETARVKLQFIEVQLANGETKPLAARLVSVDSARERVDRSGSIRGIRATYSLSNRLGERLALEVVEHPLGLIPLFVMESALLRFPDPEIDYPPGTELHLELEGALSLPPASGCVERTSDLGQSAELQHVITALPYWSYSEREHKAMDPTNLIFVGSEGEVQRAFASAGWADSRSLSPVTGLGVIRAIAEDHGDADAPMRRLLLDDRLPDMYRQKALNTFEKRHHVRVWKRPGEFEGAPIWAAAATQDVSATFSFRPFGFTHRIQTDLDLERDKIVSDFVFAGCVDEVAYIGRPEGMLESQAGRRKGLSTDGRVAVLVLNSCETPLAAPAISAADRQPPLSVRCIRRVTLTARNHFLRDNLIWRSGEAAVLGYRAVSGWRRQRIVNHLAQSGAQGTISAPVNSAWIVAPACVKPAIVTQTAKHTPHGPA